MKVAHGIVSEVLNTQCDESAGIFALQVAILLASASTITKLRGEHIEMSRSNFMPLSDEDEDDDYAHFTTETESQTKGHSRHSSNEDGHLYAGRHSVAGGYKCPRQSSLLDK